MSDIKQPFQKEGVWPGIISIFIPLIQLISVVIIGLSDTFHITNLLVFPDMLNIINLMTMIVTIACVGWFWYWRTNIFFISPTYDQKTKQYTPIQKNITNLNKKMVGLSIISLLAFTSVTILGKLNTFSANNLWGISQYLTYSLLLIVNGVAIYIWIYEIIQKKQTFQKEDFTKNIITSLSESGWITRPELKILKNNIEGGARSMEVQIDYKRLILKVSFDGLEIIEAYEKEEYEKLNNKPSVEELQSQINQLLIQLQSLQPQIKNEE